MAKIVYCVNIDLVVPLNTLIDDDPKRNKPGNNTKQQNNYSPTINEKKRALSPPEPILPWNIKLRTRLCTIMFGQASLHFKIGQRVRLLNRPVSTLGTILYVGKILIDGAGDDEKPVTNKKLLLLSANHDYLGVELDRSGKCVTLEIEFIEKLKYFISFLVGSNDGSLDGKRYFTTLPNKGLFVKPSEVTLA